MKMIFKKLNVKISLYFFVISMILVLLLSYINYKSSVQLLIENKRIQTNQELKSASVYISSYLDKIRGLSNLISRNNDIKMISDDGYNSFESLKTLIKIIQKNDDIIKNISIVSKNGKIITSDRDRNIILSDIQNESWYKKAVNSDNMAYINEDDYFIKDYGKLISISSEIKDNDKHIGLIIIDLSYNFIEDYITKINFQENGYGFIISSEEKLVFDTSQMDSDTVIENEKYIELVKSRMKELEGNFVGGIIEIPGTDWLIAGVSLTENIDILNEKLITNTITWGVFILILSLMISYFVSKSITSPITNLINNIKNVDDRFNPIIEDKHSSNEIRQLTKEFNFLLNRISNLTLSIAEKEEAKRIFELKALQSQINPHFVYNTLDTIIWLVEFGENVRAVEVTKSLGEILRKSLTINQDFVKLEEEVSHAKNYMDIQKIRYDNKFDYNLDIHNETNDLLVPKMILQPIVENSIYHGIRPKNDKAFINIMSYLKDEKLYLVVEDDGVGFQEKTNKIKNKLGGIGMSNVEQRIKILSGKDYGIKIFRQKDVTKVVYTLEIRYDIEQ